jgi:hypothetical protein
VPAALALIVCMMHAAMAAIERRAQQLEPDRSPSAADHERGVERTQARVTRWVVAAMLLGTAAISVVVPNSTDAQVDAVVIYARKTSAGETVRRKASSQAQSTAANSTVLITSSNWTTNDEDPTDHTVPPLLSFGVVWKNRWWARHAVCHRADRACWYRPCVSPERFQE